MTEAMGNRSQRQPIDVFSCSRSSRKLRWWLSVAQRLASLAFGRRIGPRTNGDFVVHRVRSELQLGGKAPDASRWMVVDLVAVGATLSVNPKPVKCRSLRYLRRVFDGSPFRRCIWTAPIFTRKSILTATDGDDDVSTPVTNDKRRE